MAGSGIAKKLDLPLVLQGVEVALGGLLRCSLEMRRHHRCREPNAYHELLDDPSPPPCCLVIRDIEDITDISRFGRVRDDRGHHRRCRTGRLVTQRNGILALPPRAFAPRIQAAGGKQH